MDSASRRYRDIPSFSSSLLDEIYRSIDERDDEQLKAKKQSKSSNECFDDDYDERRRRVSLIQKLMENKVCEKLVVARRSTADLERNRDSVCFNSSSSSNDSMFNGGFSSEGESMYGSLFKPKPIRTSITQHNEFIMKQRNIYEDSQPKGKFMKTKSKAMKIYSELKKVKQPNSPGGRLSAFLNSIFTSNRNKSKITSPSGSISGNYTETTKSKSANASTCSSASSFSRSCLSNSNSSSSRGKSINGIKRSVRFYPVSVIVDEDLQPCGHKSLETVKFANKSINEDVKLSLSEKQRHIQEAARNLLKNYQKKFECGFDNVEMNDEEEFDDCMSDASSDLFELDNLSAIGMHKYSEELPVYETTHLHTNRAIANGLFM